jgi:hypothetical protein
MRNIHEVIAEKEAELQQVVQQLDALRLVVRLLSEDLPERAKTGVGAESSRMSAAGMSAPKVKVFP